MKIRPARRKDIDRILELEEEIIRVHERIRPDLFEYREPKYSADELLRLMKSKNRLLLVAVDDHEVVGYLLAAYYDYRTSTILKPVRTLHVEDLCVDESARGRKIGSELMNEAREEALRTGCYNVTLNVWADNADALAFYENCGYRRQKLGLELVVGK